MWEGKRIRKPTDGRTVRETVGNKGNDVRFDVLKEERVHTVGSSTHGPGLLRRMSRSATGYGLGEEEDSQNPYPY